jgi:hypothetical protein
LNFTYPDFAEIIVPAVSGLFLFFDRNQFPEEIFVFLDFCFISINTPSALLQYIFYHRLHAPDVCGRGGKNLLSLPVQQVGSGILKEMLNGSSSFLGGCFRLVNFRDGPDDKARHRLFIGIEFFQKPGN